MLGQPSHPRMCYINNSWDGIQVLDNPDAPYLHDSLAPRSTFHYPVLRDHVSPTFGAIEELLLTLLFLLIHESPLTDALFLLVSKSDEVPTT